MDLCRAYGFDYVSAPTVARLAPDALAARLDALDPSDPASADALLGGAPGAEVPLSELLGFYEALMSVDLKTKDAKQIRKRRNDRAMILREFIDLSGDIDLRSLTRTHVSQYRRHLSERIVAGDLVHNSANRRIQALGKMVKAVLWDLYGVETKAFERMGWREPKKKRRNTQVSYSPTFIRERLLAPGALDRLNADARDMVLVSLNTGAGPSELVNLSADTVHLSADVPHIAIRPDGRELKNVYREREVPLVGLALEAMQRHPGGFERYRNGDSASNLINKYFRNNGLQETPGHTGKSLRHNAGRIGHRRLLRIQPRDVF